MENLLDQQSRQVKLVYQGHDYIHDINSSDDPTISFWKCESRRECEGRICVQNGNVIEVVHDHVHSSSNEQDSPPRKRKIVKSRAYISPYSRPTLWDLCILPEWQTCGNPTQPFLHMDTGPSEDRIIIFGRKRMLHVLERSKTWYMGGNMKIAPPPFVQVFVFLGKHLGGSHPVLYALLPNKKQETYVKMFRTVLALEVKFKPSKFSCNLNETVISAIKECFPDSDIHGCFFNFTSNIVKEVTAIGLQRKYKADAEFALQVRMVYGLAFVPIRLIDEYVGVLLQNLPSDLQPLLAWFKEKYIGVNASFPVEVWSQFSRTVEGEDRTNNLVNQAFRKVSSNLGVHNPAMNEFMAALKTTETLHNFTYVQLVAGRRPTARSAQSIRADERILSIVRTQEDLAPLEYLKKVASNLGKK